MKKRNCLSIPLALALPLSLMALPAAAGGPRLVASSATASTQQVGFSGFPTDAHSVQFTFTLPA